MTDEEFEAALAKLPAEELVLLKWHKMRRSEQIPPDPLPHIVFAKGGRGSGKTLWGANHIFEFAYNLPWTPENRTVRVGLVGETLSDVKRTMIEGPTGLKSILPQELIIADNRSLGELQFLIRGPKGQRREVLCNAFSSETPAALRGPQFHMAWCDEPGKLKDSNVHPETPDCTMSNLMFGLRLGQNPHLFVSGTPTPCELVKYLRDHPKAYMVTMKSTDNTSLPESQLEFIRRLPPGSRLYRQEVLGEILDDNPDGVFNFDSINEVRGGIPHVKDDDERDTEDLLPHGLVVGWDPSASGNPEGDEAGIVLVAHTKEHLNPARPKDTRTQAYVLEDLSGHYTPAEQARIVADLIMTRGVEDLVYERNQGMEFVAAALQTALQNHPDLEGMQVQLKAQKARTTKLGNIQKVRVITPIHSFTISGIHAKQNKQTRAETASMAYETGDVHHPVQPLERLESQMLHWNPLNTKNSPDRLDGLVYALLHIFGFENALKRVPNKAKMSSAAHITTSIVPSRGVGIYSADVGNGRVTPPVGVDADAVEAALSRNPYSRTIGDPW